MTANFKPHNARGKRVLLKSKALVRQIDDDSAYQQLLMRVELAKFIKEEK